MHFHPISPTACIVASEALDFTIRVDGLSADRFRGLFLGQAGRMNWLEMRNHPGLAASSPVNSTREISGQAFEKDLPDGLVRLQTGGPGKLEVAGHHGLFDALVPQSLYLLLSHQWAQAGVLPIHGAGLASGEEGILILGAKASGKSTLTAAALTTGARVISDDWLLFGRDRDRQPRAERLRQFLMLRESWASDEIRKLLPEIPFRPNAGRPKVVFSIPGDHPDFPPGATIRRIWVLSRPRGGRGRESRIRPLDATSALARLIESSMPLLYSAAFPAERQALMATASATLGNISCLEIQPGTDLITEPRETWGRLVE